MNDPIVIVSAVRTAMGSFQGGFAGLNTAIKTLAVEML